MTQTLSPESKKYWIALNMLPEIGSVRFRKLLEYFGSAKKAFFASLNEFSRIEGTSQDWRSVVSVEDRHLVIPDD